MMLKSNKGGMILLLAMSTALASVVGISTYKVIKYTHESQVTKNKFSKYQLLTLSLRSLMSRPDVCTSALKDQMFDPAQSKIDVNIESTILKEQKFIQNMKDIENSKFLLLNNGFTNDKQLAGSSDIFYTYKADLEVWLPQQKGELFFNYKNLNLRIPLYVNIDKDNKIKSCYGVYSQAAQCEKYWKSWDESETDLDQKCNPDRQCILYSASTCTPPAVQIAIAGVQVSSSSSTTGGGTSGGSSSGGGTSGGSGGSAMSAFASAGRAADSGKGTIQSAVLRVKKYKEALETMKDKLESIEKQYESLKETLDKERADLAVAQAAYNSAQAAYSSCMAPCWTCSCPPRDPDDDDYYCDCPTCSCSSESAAKHRAHVAVFEAQTRVNQVQTEFNKLEENYKYVKNIVEQGNKIDDLNNYMLTVLKITNYNSNRKLGLFNGPMLNILKAKSGEITMAEFTEKMKHNAGTFDYTHTIVNTDLLERINQVNNQPWTDSVKEEHFASLLTTEIAKRHHDQYLELKAEKERISNKYFSGLDIEEKITINTPSDADIEGTIYKPDYTSLRKIIGDDDDIELRTDPSNGDYITKMYNQDEDDSSKFHTTRLMNKIASIEKDMLSTPPSTDPPTNPGPVSLDYNSQDSWRAGMSSFKETQEFFISSSQLLYHHVAANRALSQAPINTFISFPNSGIPSSTSTPTSSIQTNMEYLCMWCNEHRKKRLVKDAEQDPVLNEMQVAQPTP
ncbi:MAG: hypothetical protein OXM55_06845 [Bdellovibrionales bacterium]|nr:hypothetical protein [Bdellovibrionales bacterium]